MHVRYASAAVNFTSKKYNAVLGRNLGTNWGHVMVPVYCAVAVPFPGVSSFRTTVGVLVRLVSMMRLRFG